MISGDISFKTLPCGTSLQVIGRVDDRKFDVNMSESRSTINLGGWSYSFLSCQMELILTNLRIDYEETSFTPMLKCGAFELDTFPQVTLYQDQTCGTYKSCSECSKDRACGWCSDGSGSCRQGNATGDSCSLCEGWSGSTCDAIMRSDCSGHGMWNNVTQRCVCTAMWKGPDCSILDPLAAMCAMTQTSTRTVSMVWLRDVFVAGWPVEEGFVSNIGLRVLGNIPGTTLRVRNRGQPSDVASDYEVQFQEAKAADQGSCLPGNLSYDFVAPGLHGGNWMWATLSLPPGTKPNMVTPATMEVTMVHCRRGFGGDGCRRTLRSLEFLSDVNSQSTRMTPQVTAYLLPGIPAMFDFSIPEFTNTLEFGSVTKLETPVTVEFQCQWEPRSTGTNLVVLTYPTPCSRGLLTMTLGEGAKPTTLKVQARLQVCPDNKLGPDCDVDILQRLRTESVFTFETEPNTRQLVMVDVRRNTFALKIRLTSETSLAARLNYGAPSVTPLPNSSMVITAPSPLQGPWFLEMQSLASTSTKIEVEVLHIMCDLAPCGYTNALCSSRQYDATHEVYECACAPLYISDPKYSETIRCIPDRTAATLSGNKTGDGSGPNNDNDKQIRTIIVTMLILGGALLVVIVVRRRMQTAGGEHSRDVEVYEPEENVPATSEEMQKTA